MKKSRNLIKDIISSIVVAVIVVLGIIASHNVASQNIDLTNTVAIGNALGAFTILPTLLALFLAFMYKNVIISLAAGMLLGALMLVGIQGFNLLGFFTVSCGGIVETVSNKGNASILLLCLAVGGMIEIIRSSGGFENLAKMLTKKIDTPKKANLITQLLGVLVFFDDYANALIVGPVMQPITDRLKISREKLAYIVDSTAAPVTGIAIISSWVAVEVGVIEEGLANANLDKSGYALFLASIPFCFYCIFCLLFILISSLTGREIGPMYEAECRARNGEVKKVHPDDVEDEEVIQSSEITKKKASLWTAVIPLVILFIYALIQFVVAGRANALANGIITGNEPWSISYLSTILGEADTIYIVFEATLLASFVAIIMGIIEKAFTLKEALASFVKGCAQLLETDLILVLAWTMSSFVSQIGTVHYTVHAISSSVPWWLVPILIFVVCCLVSFAVGSYGCMFIALPIAIPIAAKMMEIYPNITSNYLPLIIACGLAGCIFGDHCSPITDCTILSSEGSGCNNFDHVQTQLPYALITAIVSILIGIIPATFGIPASISLVLGIVAFYIILKLFGRVPSAKS